MDERRAVMPESLNGGIVTPMPISCKGCGVDFEPNYPEQRYHSQSCWMRSYNRDNPDGHSQRGARKGGRTRGAQMKAAASGKGYVKRSGTDDHEHRVVAEEVLQRRLHPREVVHHEDQNKQNNDPANLIVFVSQAQHARHHLLGHCGLEKCDCYGIRLKEVM